METAQVTVLTYETLALWVWMGITALFGAGGGMWLMRYIVESYNHRRDIAAKEIVSKAIDEYAASNSKVFYKIQKESSDAEKMLLNRIADLEKEFRGFTLDSSVRFGKTDSEIQNHDRQIQDIMQQIRVVEERVENRLNNMDSKIDQILASVVRKAND